MELFENADVTASIYNPSEHALGSLRIMRGHIVHLFSVFEHHSVVVWTGIILNTLLVWTRYFFVRIKKMRFQKYPDTCGRGLKLPPINYRSAKFTSKSSLLTKCYLNEALLLEKALKLIFTQWRFRKEWKLQTSFFTTENVALKSRRKLRLSDFHYVKFRSLGNVADWKLAFKADLHYTIFWTIVSKIHGEKSCFDLHMVRARLEKSSNLIGQRIQQLKSSDEK